MYAWTGKTKSCRHAWSCWVSSIHEGHYLCQHSERQREREIICFYIFHVLDTLTQSWCWVSSIHEGHYLHQHSAREKERERAIVLLKANSSQCQMLIVHKTTPSVAHYYYVSKTRMWSRSRAGEYLTAYTWGNTECIDIFSYIVLQSYVVVLNSKRLT